MNYNVLDFGAHNSTNIDSTEAFARAIAACAEAGGGYVDVPAGQYVCGTIRLESYVYLRLHPGSTILGSEHLKDYSGTARGCAWTSALETLVQNKNVNVCRALIVADRKTHCGIVGHGKIDGRRSAKHGYTEEKGRPCLVVFSECTHATIRDVTLTNSGFFTFYGLNCSDMLIDGVTVRTADCANGDGLDFDGGRRITISNCNIDAGDDAIGLKTLTPSEPCEDFTITNCILKSKHWAAVRIGPESAGDMRRINVQGCCMYDSGDGFKIQLTQDAVYEDFIFTNITMTDVLRPIFFTLNRYNMSAHVKDIRPQTGTFRRVKLSHITATMRPSSHFGDLTIHAGNYISALPQTAIEDVTLQDVHIIAPGGGTQAEADRTDGHGDMYDFWGMYPEHLRNMGDYPSAVLYVRNAKHVKLRDCTFETALPDARAAIAAECVDHLSLVGCEARGCGALLRHHRCTPLQADTQDTDSLIGFTPAQAEAWESFRADSLKADRMLEELAARVQAVIPLVPTSRYTVLEFDVTQGATHLLIPKCRGNFSVLCNKEEIASLILPAPYHTDPHPFALDLSPHLTGGKQATITIVPREDFELMTDILVGTPE